ncbi:unnamed protein product [Cuscuta campestris]|uniref:Uncharacterized protein n=1 Tax=Cuscuta campestris TaxID=132261 RepID=A0A484NI23_9ASTE|nr:unnamed protein product [Cuscuta campestris]
MILFFLSSPRQQQKKKGKDTQKPIVRIFADGVLPFLKKGDCYAKKHHQPAATNKPQLTEGAGDQCEKEPNFIDVFAVQYIGPPQPLFPGFASAIARTHNLHRLIKPPKSITAAGSKACSQPPSPIFRIAARSPSLGLIQG